MAIFPARATDYTWTGGGTDTNWTRATNWSPNSAYPVANTDNAIFSGTPTATMPTVNGNILLLGLTFQTATGGWTINTSGTSSFLKIYSGGINALAQTSGTTTINASLTAQNSSHWSVGTGGTLVFNGGIGGTNTITFGTLTTGAGTIILNNGDLGGTTLARSGGSILEAGTIVFNNDSAFGITDSSGAIAPRTVTFSSGNTATLTSTGNHTMANSINLAGNGRIGSSGTLVITGAIGTSGGTAKTLTKVDSGTVVLTGASSYTGGTIIESGTLQVGNNGTTGSISDTGGVDTGASASNTLDFKRSDTYVYGGTIVGSGKIRQSGSGTTVLTAANTTTGGTEVTAGTLQLGNGGTTGSVTGDVAISEGATLAVNHSNNISITRVISGKGRFVQSGSGQTQLSVANSYSGGTTVSAGILRVTQADALGTGGLLVTGSGKYTTGILNVNSYGLTIDNVTASVELGNAASTGRLHFVNGTDFAMSAGTLLLSYTSNTSYDQFFGDVGSIFTIDGGVLDLGNYAWDYNATYQIFSNFDSGSVANLSIINYDTTTYVAKLSDSGVLSFAVPEPSTWALLIMSLAFFAYQRRNRSAKLPI